MSYTHSKGAFGGGGGVNLDMAKMSLSYTGISLMMAMEDKTKKNTIVFVGFCWGVLCTVLAGFYWARVDSVMKWQSIVTKNSDTDIIAYDVGCFSGPFSDNEAAANLRDDLEDCDKDCQDLGSQWSVVFICNAVIMLLLIINFTCVCFGSRIVMCRLLAAWFACCICCAHFPIIITTAVFRFRPQGALCALSTANTYFADDESMPTDDWTYEKDGSLILALWIIQLLCCCCCCGAGATASPKR